MDAQNPLYPWITLSLVPGFGPAKWHQLLTGYTTPQLVSLSDSELIALGFSQSQCQALRDPDKQRLDNTGNWLQRSERHFVITWDDKDYPAPLREISRPPLVLFGRGDRTCLAKMQMAVVGSRRPTEYGRRLASEFSYQLTQRGWVITSGLASGIDGAAHQGAVNARGPTVAVLGTGPDRVYPARHQRLVNSILDCGGLLVSEFIPGEGPKAQHFPRRNRIITGLSKGVLVVEAALKSGSLISAKYALEQNREVFAIPGNVHSPLSAGCHALIRQGAVLVQTVDELVDELTTVSPSPAGEYSSDQQKNSGNLLATDSLLDSVDYDVTSLDRVAERSQLDIHVVTARLLEYELRGLVAAVPGGYIKLRG